MMKVLIDNGHGRNTSGKRSPNGLLKEYAWTRDVAKRLERKLKFLGVDAQRIVHEDEDIALSERCTRVNKICQEVGSGNAILVSLHINASGYGEWKAASGWTSWVYTGCSEKSKVLAQVLYAEAEKRHLQGNRSVPQCKYLDANFYLLKHTACPAVLTENLFMDNKSDYDYLMSEQGKEIIADLHVDGILAYIEKYDK